ncbi:MAG: GFA family protein [Pseudomonadota bacterium]
MTTMQGGCQCGRIRYEAKVPTNDAYLCHCRMCQRATGGVSIAFVNLPRSDVTWLTEPDWYQSSPIARRPFCSRCGTPLGFQFLEGDRMDLTVGSFDDPYRFVPTENFGAEGRHAAWEDTSHLPSERCDQAEATVTRWLAATGEVPSTKCG